MEAYDNLGKLLKECEFNPEVAGQKIVSSLVPLTRFYKGQNLEIILHQLKEGKLFSYIFAPQHLPGFIGMFAMRTQISLQFMSSSPIIKDLPIGNNGSYVFVQNGSGEYQSLYFINGKNQYEPVKKFNLTKDALSFLLKELYQDTTTNTYEHIASLSPIQIDLIEKITDYVPTMLYTPGINERLEDWDAIIPNVVDSIVSQLENNSGLSFIKRIHRLGVPANLTMGTTLFDFYWPYSNNLPPQQYISHSYVIKQKKHLMKQTTNFLCVQTPNIHQLFVVKKEADTLLAIFASGTRKSKTSVTKQIKIYDLIKLTHTEITSLSEKISNETAESRVQRIAEAADKWRVSLKIKFPRELISREPIIKMLHKVEGRIYNNLGKKQVSVETYIRKDRVYRTEYKNPPDLTNCC